MCTQILAFDSVIHGLLTPFGINGPLRRWFESYLKDRVQYIKYKKNISNGSNVLSGLPQGSHLDLFLFIIFINDVSLCVRLLNF